MSKEYTIKSIKETIKNMLLEDAEITKILLNGEDNTYKNVKELFGKYIFDYHRNSDIEYMHDCASYIDFDVNRNAYRHKFTIVLSVKMHKNVIHRNNDNVNYLDLLTEKIVAKIEKTFGENLVSRSYKDDVTDRVSNQVIDRKDNFAERGIVFFL